MKDKVKMEKVQNNDTSSKLIYRKTPLYMYKQPACILKKNKNISKFMCGIINESSWFDRERHAKGFLHKSFSESNK